MATNDGFTPKRQGILQKLVQAVSDTLLPPHRRRHTAGSPMRQAETQPQDDSFSNALARQTYVGARTPVPHSRAYKSAMRAMQSVKSPASPGSDGFSATTAGMASSTGQSSAASIFPHHSYHSPSSQQRTVLSHPEVLPAGTLARLDPYPSPTLSHRLPSAMLPLLVEAQERLQKQLLGQLKKAAAVDALHKLGITPEAVVGDEELCGLVDACVEHAFDASGQEGTQQHGEVPMVTDEFVDALAMRMATAILDVARAKHITAVHAMGEARRAGRRRSVLAAGVEGGSAREAAGGRSASPSKRMSTGAAQKSVVWGDSVAFPPHQRHGRRSMSGGEDAPVSSSPIARQAASPPAHGPDLDALVVAVQEMAAYSGIGLASGSPSKQVWAGSGSVSSKEEEAWPDATSERRRRRRERLQSPQSSAAPPSPARSHASLGSSSSSAHAHGGPPVNPFHSQDAVEQAARVLSPAGEGHRLPEEATRGRLPAPVMLRAAS